MFWFRCDLRLEDNCGLHEALTGEQAVLPVFIFDQDILNQLEDPFDSRVTFIHRQVQSLHQKFKKSGSGLLVRYGRPEQVWQELILQYQPAAVFCNRDYEPYTRQRDVAVQTLLNENGVSFFTFKDQVILEPHEVVKEDGNPYTVFTPYAKKWKAVIGSNRKSLLKNFNTHSLFQNLKTGLVFDPIPGLEEMGFKQNNQVIPPGQVDHDRLLNYAAHRDFPYIQGTSRLGIHLRFGTLSIRELIRQTGTLSESFLNELIWREFYKQILYHFPRVEKQAFRPDYDRIVWRNNPAEFERWCQGKTGYPLVDAGMRELNATGFMHNRVRMVTASFLCKHLLIDWRWGEAYFASRLLDYDLSSNNGGWQWAAGSGTDAAPYFRIFNPTIQAKKFDPQEIYIRKWIPEYGKPDYHSPLVNHKEARDRCLRVYKQALSP